MGDVDRNRVLVVGAGPCGLRYDYHHINRQKVTILIDEVPILHDKKKMFYKNTMMINTNTREMYVRFINSKFA